MNNEERMHKLANGTDTAIWAHKEIIELREQLVQQTDAVNAKPDDFEMPEEPYFIRKYGRYYGHNNCGYTESILRAEVYTKEYAENYAKNADEISAVSIENLQYTVAMLDKYLSRISKIRNWLAFKEGPYTTKDKGE